MAGACCPEQQIFLLRWLNQVIHWFLYDIVGFSYGSKVAQYSAFVLEQGIKTALLITVMIYLIGLVRAGLKPSKVELFLKGKKPAWGYIAGAFLGIVTPFCSCAAVPIFLAFSASGIPVGVTITFLVTAPLITEAGLILTTDAFGAQFALLSLLLSVLIGVSAGLLFSFLEKRGVTLFRPHSEDEKKALGRVEIGCMKERHQYALGEVSRIGRRVAPWLVASILVAGLLQLFVTPDVVTALLAKDSFWSVPLAVFVGIPTYGTSGSIIPVAMVLLQKGAAVGAVLAFILAVNGASLPAFIMLKPVFTRKGLSLLFLFFLFSFTMSGFAVNLFL